MIERCRRFDTLGWEFPSWSATPGPAFNILKGGILAADRVLTVSEVCTPQGPLCASAACTGPSCVTECS